MTQPLAPTNTGPNELDLILDQVAARQAHLSRFQKAWTGTSPASFLSAKSREALDDKLSRLGVNFPRLAVQALAERQTLSGINTPDGTLWEKFTEAGGRELAELVHTDRLLYGSAYVTVWATETGRPTLTGDSAHTMMHEQDPATGEVTMAARVWHPTASTTRLAIYRPEQVELYAGDTATPTSHALKRTNTIDNPLGVVPVVPFIRRRSLADPITGASAVEDLLDLTDAVAKILNDAMVTSEFHARPRRWATGLEIEEDEDGKPMDPFGEGRFLQSEDPDTKFGQLDGARLDGYSDMLATLTQQIGALSGLPPHYLGLHGDQPASADGIRAAEAQLTARASSEQRHTANEWQQVGWLLDAVSRGVPADQSALSRIAVTWESPETSSPAMNADAAAKLRGIGVPLEEVLIGQLGYEPDVARKVAESARVENILRGGSQ